MVTSLKAPSNFAPGRFSKSAARRSCPPLCAASSVPWALCNSCAPFADRTYHHQSRAKGARPAAARNGSELLGPAAWDRDGQGLAFELDRHPEIEMKRRDWQCYRRVREEFARVEDAAILSSVTSVTDILGLWARIWAAAGRGQNEVRRLQLAMK